MNLSFTTLMMIAPNSQGTVGLNEKIHVKPRKELPGSKFSELLEVALSD